MKASFSKLSVRNLKSFIAQRELSSSGARGQLQQAAVASYFEEDQLALQKTTKSIINYRFSYLKLQVLPAISVAKDM